MKTRRMARGWRWAWLAAGLLAGPAWGYVEAPFTIGKVIEQSTNILVLRVEKLDKEKNLIVYRKVRDIKGTHPGEEVKHNIGRRGFHPRESRTIMAWAEVGKIAVFFHNGGAGETCIDNYWYQVYRGDWWSMSHGEPYLLRSFAGKPEKLATVVSAMLAGREVVVPCMVDGDKQALQLRKARVQRLRAGLKILDYDPKRDFAGWGAEEFQAITNMPGFSHYTALSRVDPGAAGIAPADFDQDGKLDLCLFGASRLSLLHNAGASLDDVALPVGEGARGADWADLDGDGRPDLVLASPSGPRVFLNQKTGFKDATSRLPPRSYYNLKAAACLDYDGDGKPDILLADGFSGLRLYRNLGAAPKTPAKPKIGKWYYAGPFDNTDNRGFAAVYPPETRIDLAQQYVGKNNQKVAWREGRFQDGKVNNLAMFGGPGNYNSVVYLYRELDFGGATVLPVSLGSDDSLTVWLNGNRLLAENVQRNCTPDQVTLKLNLAAGKNRLLLKICQGSGQFAFFFALKEPAAVMPRLFEDVSDAAGLGVGGAAGTLKGDHLAVADVNGDGRCDFLYSAGTGVLVLNTPRGFVEARKTGLSYRAGGIDPAFGDFDGDKRPDLFVPQRGRCKLFRNAGGGRFVDVTAKAGALADPVGWATCAAWADFAGDGRLDLFVGCLRTQNRYFRNLGGGAFADATGQIGFYQRIFNTRALCVVDLNKDGALDVVLNNEGTESAVLLGDPARGSVASGEAQAN